LNILLLAIFIESSEFFFLGVINLFGLAFCIC